MYHSTADLELLWQAFATQGIDPHASSTMSLQYPKGQNPFGVLIFSI
jgi:hypothetical protein